MNYSTDELIASLQDKITESFVKLFSEADQELNIKTWSDRFKILGTDGEESKDDQANWTIIFEDTQEPYAHFILHMNGHEPDDFSIDS